MQVSLQVAFEVAGSAHRQEGTKPPTNLPIVLRSLDQLLQSNARSSQARGDGALRHSQGDRDLAIGVSVEVAEHDRGRLFGRQLTQGSKQVGSLGDRGGISRRRRPAQTAEHRSRLLQAFASLRIYR